MKDAVRRLPVIAKTEGKVKGVHLVLGRGAELRASIVNTIQLMFLSFINVVIN